MAKKNKDNDLKKNGSGYYDPTAYNAIKKLDEEESDRFYKLLDAIYDICELSGFHVEEHIVLKDKRTGRVWR